MNNSMFRNLGLAVALLLPGTNFALSEIYTPKAVVELFTSQGCSSCPPADEILSEFADGEDVLALAWHVDYWNYLGWKDTFSKAQFTTRQRRYATSLRERQIYTPQAIINGRDHAVGSRKGEIDRLIKGFKLSGKDLFVPIKVSITGDQMQIRINDKSAGLKDPTLYMIYYNKAETVEIKRGENRGKTITYRNIVRQTQLLGMLKDGSISVDLPLSEIKRLGYDSCAILLQETTSDGTPGAIIGATVIDNFDA